MIESVDTLVAEVAVTTPRRTDHKALSTKASRFKCVQQCFVKVDSWVMAQESRVFAAYNEPQEHAQPEERLACLELHCPRAGKHEH